MRADLFAEPEGGELPGQPLGFSLRMGGEGGAGQGWHLASTVGWSPLRWLELQLLTSVFSVPATDAAGSAGGVRGLFAGMGPRVHLYPATLMRLGLWGSLTAGWAQVASAPAREGTGLAGRVALGISVGDLAFPHRATDVSLFVARQFGVARNDDELGMVIAGLALDVELGPHRSPTPSTATSAPSPRPLRARSAPTARRTAAHRSHPPRSVARGGGAGLRALRALREIPAAMSGGAGIELDVDVAPDRP